MSESQQRDIDQLVGLLTVAKCPNSDCADGSIAHQVSESDWEAEQCQFCYEKSVELAKHKEQE